MTSRMLYLHALTPVHSGTGQGSGVVDLPIARSKVTGRPIIPGSSVKGVLRDHGFRMNKDMAKIVFGPDSEHAEDHAGAIWFPDAHLLCLPVRSLHGSFAWVTSPMVLRHWQRDVTGSPTDHATPAAPLTIPAAAAGDLKALVTGTSVLASTTGTVYFEEIDLSQEVNAEATTLAKAIGTATFTDADWQTEFSKRFAIVPDDIFAFLAQHAIEVIARIRLKEETKTVARGALWYEEAVPAESIFATPLIFGDVKLNGHTEKDLFDHIGSILDNPAWMLQFGGNASVGRGLMKGRLA